MSYLRRPDSIRRLAVPLGAALIAAALLPTVSFAQDLHPSRRPSPMGSARIHVDDTYLSLVYSRPYKRNRDNIFGDGEEFLVPYGQLWRLGANEATELTVTGDVTVAGKRLPAGTYSVFATPGPERWTLHFNSELGLSGTARPDPETGQFVNVYDPKNDVVTATATSSKLADEVDQLTIAFEATDAGADLVIQWITTEVRFPIATSD